MSDPDDEVKKWLFTCWVEDCGAQFFASSRARLIRNLLSRNHLGQHELVVDTEDPLFKKSFKHLRKTNAEWREITRLKSAKVLLKGPQGDGSEQRVKKKKKLRKKKKVRKKKKLKKDKVKNKKKQRKKPKAKIKIARPKSSPSTPFSDFSKKVKSERKEKDIDFTLITASPEPVPNNLINPRVAGDVKLNAMNMDNLLDRIYPPDPPSPDHQSSSSAVSYETMTRKLEISSPGKDVYFNLDLWRNLYFT